MSIHVGTCINTAGAGSGIATFVKKHWVDIVAGIGALGAALCGIELKGVESAICDLAGGIGGQGAAGADINDAAFAQKSFSETFSKGGLFAGKTIDDVANELRSGELSPKDAPINVVVRDGHTLILNTRSAQALIRAGIPRSQWRVVNRAGDPLYEELVSGQLKRNGLTSSGYRFPG
jgi:hypothetical protein